MSGGTGSSDFLSGPVPPAAGTAAPLGGPDLSSAFDKQTGRSGVVDGSKSAIVPSGRMPFEWILPMARPK
ncbi:hypothetical protein GCM10020219_098520 [Nonomuraea dietziae]